MMGRLGGNGNEKFLNLTGKISSIRLLKQQLFCLTAERDLCKKEICKLYDQISLTLDLSGLLLNLHRGSPTERGLERPAACRGGAISP